MITTVRGLLALTLGKAAIFLAISLMSLVSNLLASENATASCKDESKTLVLSFIPRVNL